MEKPVEQFILEYWQVITLIFAFLVNAIMTYKDLKDKPSKEMVKKMIEDKFGNHCPFTERINTLETQQKDIVEYRGKLAIDLARENEANHLALQRIELNLKRVCDKISIGYLDTK